MARVATLISNPARPALDAAVLERLRRELPDAEAPHWLAPDVAADVPFADKPDGDNRMLADRLRGVVADLPIDVVVQPAAGRRKRLFLADMDSTMIGQECIDELADFVNLKPHVSAITERAMRGEIAFEPALRERVALLKGLPSTVIAEVIRDRIRLTPGARALVMTMRANGAYTCLVSGGFKSFTDSIAEMIGFDENRSNSLLMSDDGTTLTGFVQEPIFGRETKLETLCELRQTHGVAKDATLVTGDGANDIAMIQEAGLGVAYHAKPQVAATAQARIDHGDLTALLYLQGYQQREFIAA
jgi:phosphoserine phosphatase